MNKTVDMTLSFLDRAMNSQQRMKTISWRQPH